jgi:hypothetical protein
MEFKCVLLKNNDMYWKCDDYNIYVFDTLKEGCVYKQKKHFKIYFTNKKINDISYKSLDKAIEECERHYNYKPIVYLQDRRFKNEKY